MATFRFYRAVADAPALWQKLGGFVPWVTIPLAEVRKMLLNAFKGQANAVAIPDAAEVLKKCYEVTAKWSALDLAREIKREKSRSTCHVSTDLREECGGYAAGNYVYQIEFEDLYVNDEKNNQRRTDLSPMVKPKLVANAAAIGDATALAIASGGDEVSFLTPIPLANIVKYRAPNSPGWANCAWE